MTKKILKYKGLLLLIGIYLLLLVGIKGELINFYWENIIKLALINIILVVSLNLSTGLLGQLNLAHSAFMAIGAYACVFFTRNLFFPGFINFLFGLFLGGILAMIFAYLISAPAMKIPGNYLIIATIAANEVIKDLIINLNILGGSSGIHGISCYSHFSFVYLTMALVIISIYMIEDSKYGRAIMCIPQNEMLAKSCGIDTFHSKLFVFSIAAFFAGIAGGLYAHEMTVIEPNMFNFGYSLELLAMVIIGGLGNIIGSIVSAFLFSVLPHVLNIGSELKVVIHVTIMILVIIFMKKNLILNYKRFLLDVWDDVKKKFRSGGVLS